MFHPTMLMLCTINIDTFKCQDEVDYTYLQQSKEQILTREVDALCNRILSDEFLFTVCNGMEIAMTTQFVGTKQVKISRYTALILTRLKEAAQFLKKNMTGSEYDDISDDITISRIEAIPNSIYSTVYNILSNESAAARASKVGIRKLNEIRKKILLHKDKEAATISQGFLQKIKDISTVGFWRVLLYHDYLKVYDSMPAPITCETLNNIKRELQSLDIYGFVPPDKVVETYKTTSVSRKLNIQVDDFVISYLTEIVRSGGVEV